MRKTKLNTLPSRLKTIATLILLSMCIASGNTFAQTAPSQSQGTQATQLPLSGRTSAERLSDGHAVIHSGGSDNRQHTQSHGSSSRGLLGKYIWYFQHAVFRQAVFARRHPTRP